jgi:PAS domain S-box-containing protein
MKKKIPSDKKDLVIALNELVILKKEARSLMAQLKATNRELALSKKEKGKRNEELGHANKELAFQAKEKGKRAAELIIANKELEFQNRERGKRANELAIVNKKLQFQNKEKGKRAAELELANKELKFQHKEKANRAAELKIANKELGFQNKEKGKRANELVVANKELKFQNKEKSKRAAELELANKELKFQNKEKAKRAAELIIANKELAFQNSEKGKRVAELNIANIELEFQNVEKEKRAVELSKAYQKIIYKKGENKKGEEANKSLMQQNDSIKFTSQYTRSLIEASLDSLMAVSVDGKITDVNHTFEDVSGLSVNQLVGTNFSDRFVQSKAAKELYKKGLISGYFTDHALTLKCKNGKELDMLLSGSQYKSEDGKVQGLFVTVKDVTKKNLEDEKNKDRLNQLQSLIENLPVAVYTCDEKGFIQIYNKVACQLWGMIPEIGKNKYCGSWKMFKKDLTLLDHDKCPMALLLRKGKLVKNPEIIIERPDGTRSYIIMNPQPILDHAGKLAGAINTLIDVTKERKSAEEYKLLSKYSLSLIEASRDPMFAINISGKVTDINEAAVKITDETRDQLLHSDFINYFTDPEKAKAGYLKIFEEGFVEDYPLTVKDGTLTPVLFNGSVFKNDAGHVVGAVAVARVITEQKRYERELTEARELAERAKIVAEEATGIAQQAVKAKQQFLSNMSHEIRTPMNAIIGFTKVLIKSDLTPKQYEYLNAIKLSGDAMIVLINDILDLAKVDSGKMTFEQIPFKMAYSISAMLHLFETKIQEKNLELKLEYDQNIPTVLIGDPVRLHQIILNLVSNAVKFTNKGIITVTINLENEDNNKVGIKFSVKDTGIGIPKDKISSIFENFQQASSNTSRLYGGTGLGLSIVKQLVEPQGGTIKVESNVGEGSEFTFMLNFIKTTEVDLPVEQNIEANIDNKNIRVLVVEDIALNQLLMKTLLEEFGFTHDIAKNGKVAIEKVQENNYDIILMDLQMPEMNGFEATDYIRNILDLKIPIIALTADVTSVDIEKCKSIGMNDYIAKPVDEKLLYNKINGLVLKPDTIKPILKIKELKKEMEGIRSVNLEYLIKRTKADPFLMLEMIELYLEQTPVLISEMKKSIKENDWISMFNAAHKMIPSFVIMGISSEFEMLARKIQDYASVRKQALEVNAWITELDTVCTQACKELMIECNRIKSENK